jgi:cbb3-type cytochrome oxidase maturation protein
MTLNIGQALCKVDFCIIISNMAVFIIIALISLLIAGGFLIAFLWGVNDGQFDDDYSPPNRLLFDNKPTIEN